MDAQIRTLLAQQDIGDNPDIIDLPFDSFAAMSLIIDRSTIQKAMQGNTPFILAINQEKYLQLSPEEQKAVILHEIGHIKRGLYRGPLLYFGPACSAAAFSILPLISLRNQLPLTKRLLVAAGSALIGKYLGTALSALLARHEEYAADAYAVDAGCDRDALCSALEKRGYFFRQEKSGIKGALEVHPAIEQRINALKNRSKKVDR